MSCNTCGKPPTVVFNDDTLACDDCKDARFEDDRRVGIENDLWWPLKTNPAEIATITA